MDLPLCVSSGMTFRWSKLDDGSWAGVDGGTWFVVREEVQTNQGAAAFDRLFHLDRSLEVVKSEILSAAPELEPCLCAIQGLRVLKTEPEETFFTFLCTPNNNAERIGKMVRILESYGDPIEDAPFDARTFPPGDRIAAIPEEELRARNFGYRGRTIPLAARELLERGEGWLQSLVQATYQEAHLELCSISGIGPKLADCICLFGLGFSEAVPVDTHLWQSACRTYFPEWKGKSMTDLRYREIGDLFRAKFGKLAGWAHQYMFYENFSMWRSRKAGGEPGVD